jgi:precorrin-4 methylase
VVWADSLVHPDVVALARPEAEVVGSAACPTRSCPACPQPSRRPPAWARS